MGEENRGLGQAGEQEKQLGLVNARNQPLMGQTVRKKGSGGKLLPAVKAMLCVFSSGGLESSFARRLAGFQRKAPTREFRRG
jgi:hypothetical protein